MYSTKENIRISVIIPIFNEEGRVYNLNALWSYIKNKKYIRELIVVDDGSTDKSAALLTVFQKKTKCVVVSYRKNKGKGYAIKRGVFSSRGTHILFMDVDLSTPPKMIGVLKNIVEHIDVVVGTRKNKKALLLQRQSKMREMMGVIFTYISQFILGVEVSDFTCGFKCFKIKTAKKIFAKQRINRWAFDAESLFLAKKYGFSIRELAVEWKDVRGTKVRFPQDVFQSFGDVIKIRINDILGKY